MQTTLRIQDDLYREAKAQAARMGTTLTKFIEGSLEARLASLRTPVSGKPHHFRTYDPGDSMPLTWQEIKKIDNDAVNRRELAKLGLDLPADE
jgi:hypothetical protein